MRGEEIARVDTCVTYVCIYRYRNPGCTTRTNPRKLDHAVPHQTEFLYIVFAKLLVRNIFEGGGNTFEYEEFVTAIFDAVVFRNRDLWRDLQLSGESTLKKVSFDRLIQRLDTWRL